jgi:hypothetical protein
MDRANRDEAAIDSERIMELTSPISVQRGSLESRQR